MMVEKQTIKGHLRGLLKTWYQEAKKVSFQLSFKTASTSELGLAGDLKGDVEGFKCAISWANAIRELLCC